MVVTSAVAAVFAAAILLLVVRYASRHPDNVHLGNRVFSVAKASRLAARIHDERTPFLFRDPLASRGVGREIYVQHLGADSNRGWLAFAAYAPDAPRRIECILRWDRAAARFHDPCGGADFPSNGRGLTQYPASVNAKGIVVVDLNPRTATGAPAS